MRRLVTLALPIMIALVIAPMASANTPFLGEVDLVAFNFAPKGWALCEGQLLSINQNTALFSLLGTQYGGDGISTFALPDLRGRMAVGMDQGPGLSNRIIGQNGGEEQVTLAVIQMPSHTHQAYASSSANGHSPAGAVWGAQPQVFLYSSGSSNLVAMHPQAIGATGGGQAHDNMPPYLVMTYIIALQGIFPSRN